MNLSLYAVRPGATGDFDEQVRSYLTRSSRVLPAEASTFRTERELLRQVEQQARRGALRFWLMDSRGVLRSSEQFAEELRRARESGARQIVFGIGPADGWSAEALNRAEMLLSLGPMTLPHELARLVLAEQIYRATTILAGHPYHLGH